MAKRARGSHRPGQRPPLQRTAGRSAPEAPSQVTTTKPASLTPQEEARAAELEAQIVAEERAADEAHRRTAERRRVGPTQPDGTPRATLAVSASEEYAYVGRDVRRITLIGGSLIIFLIVLAIVTHLSGSGPI